VLTLWSLVNYPIISFPAFLLYCRSYCDGSPTNVSKDRTWPSFCTKFPVFSFLREYFPQRLHLRPFIGGMKKEKRQYIFAVHPHGSMADYRPVLDAQLQEQLPDIEIRWLAASVLFLLPIVREICLWTRCIDARRSVAEKALQKGLSIGVVPGGEQEQLDTTFGEESVFLKKRFGFVKLALQFGAPLVPVYVFGCTDLYKTSKAGYPFRKLLVRCLGVCLPFCYGKYGMPLSPFKQPLDIVFGKPVELGPACPNPSKDQIANAHEKYTEALQKLFDEEKRKFGFGSRSLQIV